MVKAKLSAEAGVFLLFVGGLGFQVVSHFRNGIAAFRKERWYIPSHKSNAPQRMNKLF